MGIFNRQRSLQPWLEYFELLQAYEQKGYLDVYPEKREAYIIRPVFLILGGLEIYGAGGRAVLRKSRVITSARCIRTYAGWKSQHGGDYLSHPFALHVVEDGEPHDPLYTLLITSRRAWWRLWMWGDRMEVISYGKKVDGLWYTGSSGQ